MFKLLDRILVSVYFSFKPYIISLFHSARKRPVPYKRKSSSYYHDDYYSSDDYDYYTDYSDDYSSDRSDWSYRDEGSRRSGRSWSRSRSRTPPPPQGHPLNSHNIAARKAKNGAPPGDRPQQNLPGSSAPKRSNRWSRSRSRSFTP